MLGDVHPRQLTVHVDGIHAVDLLCTVQGRLDGQRTDAGADVENDVALTDSQNARKPDRRRVRSKGRFGDE